ncbi:nitroreductase family protein [Cognatiluteimonas lumbrici]|uniref:nitroreductase family protein n=1 Tax=Cognatiluteimonas lumbrici TaxID=2559601 RepID=UPI00112B21EA|nr:nitroreductase [Luteimonas lumbrici]
MNAFFTSLNSRSSIPARLLGEPGPDEATLQRMLEAAVRVPDHGRRVPWRFIRIAGDARDALGETLVRRALERDPQASQATLDKDRGRFGSPLVIAVVARLGEDPKIPEAERFASAACVCFALLQAAQGSGFGAQWLTGWPAYDEHVLRLLGLGADERIAGFIHVGTPQAEAPQRERPDPRQLLTDWRPA